MKKEKDSKKESPINDLRLVAELVLAYGIKVPARLLNEGKEKEYLVYIAKELVKKFSAYRASSEKAYDALLQERDELRERLLDFVAVSGERSDFVPLKDVPYWYVRAQLSPEALVPLEVRSCGEWWDKTRFASGNCFPDEASARREVERRLELIEKNFP